MARVPTLSLLALVLLSAGCSLGKPELTDTQPADTASLDADGDGVPGAEDCDDADPDAHPGALELCGDGVDSDCDGADGDASCDPTTEDLRGDADGDGVVAAEDCDDLDPEIHPGAHELCDWVDNDCDGEIDEAGAIDGVETWLDLDGDGFGDEAQPSTWCEDTEGEADAAQVLISGDCDDADAAIHPAAVETCDGLDNDCDGDVDEDTGETVYIDADGDGYGDPDGETALCYEGELPDGYAPAGDDCDDTDPSYHWTDYYLDSDGDGAGGSTPVYVCTWPGAGYTTDGNDCDERDANVHPGAVEECDGVDSDCDGTDDDPEATDAETWYYDGDGDGYGDDSVSQKGCVMPPGYVSTPGDCDDTDAAIYPGATETCNGVDDDCNGSDDGAGASSWYPDDDEDGYGDRGAASVSACADADGLGPDGYVADSTDCDDGDPLVHPEASDADCDETDDDCDGLADDETYATYYFDADQDGYGAARYPLAQSNCDVLDPRYVAVSGERFDCDDSDHRVTSGEDEVCGDGTDDDCDGETDETDCL